MGRFTPSRGSVPGSTEFGTVATDTHEFTGSLDFSGSIFARGIVAGSAASAGSYIALNSSKQLVLSNPSSGGDTDPGGSDTQMQYNDGGNFGGAASLTYNDSTGHLNVIDDKKLYFGTSNDASIEYVTTAQHLKITGAAAGISMVANVLPGSDNAYTLGDSSTRWSDIYAMNLHTGDLHLKNHKGDWTLIEDENFLTIRNNKTGKTFKLLMEEIG